jgi:hypothetical protein
MGGYCNLLSVLDASQVVGEAVSMEEAATKLQAFWRLHHEHLQIQPPPPKKVKKSSEYTVTFRRPLLWKYLRSYAVAERSSAAKLLLSGCRACRSDPTVLRFSLIRILLRQMEQYVVMSPRSTKSTDYYVAPSERLAVEWSALLSELLGLCSSDAAEVDSAAHDESSTADQEVTAAVYYVLPRIAHMILDLSMRRHNKATAALVQMLHSLLSMRCVEREPSRDRLQFLQDRCLWQRTTRTREPDEPHPTSTTTTTTTTTATNGTSLSPLACLIAAYYMSHHPKLAELVDPAWQGVVIVKEQQQQQEHSSSLKQPGKNRKNTFDDEKEAGTVVAVGLLPDQNDFFFCHHQSDDVVADNDDDEEDDDDDDEEEDDDDDDGDDNKEDNDEEANNCDDDEVIHDNPICPSRPTNDDHDDDVKDKSIELQVIDRTGDMENEAGDNQNHDDSNNREREESEDENENSDSEEDEICLDVGWERAENDGAANKKGVGEDDSSEDREIYDDDEDDDGEEDHDIDEANMNNLGVVMQEDDMDSDELQAVVAAQAASQEQQMHRQPGDGKSDVSTATGAIIEHEEAPLERRKLFISAAMQVLELLHPHHAVQQYQNNSNSTSSRVNHLLSIRAENSLVKSINKSVKPPVKPLNFKILLRRLPSQEEFFLGSLSKNPLSLNMLRNNDPTIKDLRDYIASQLQMTDSAELYVNSQRCFAESHSLSHFASTFIVYVSIEILVANKILDVNLKLRLVHAGRYNFPHSCCRSSFFILFKINFFNSTCSFA